MLRSIILDLNLFADVGKMVSPANLYVSLYVKLIAFCKRLRFVVR